MLENWSLMLNVISLIGVVFVIGRMLKKKKDQARSLQYYSRPSIGQDVEHHHGQDEIISVRKITGVEPAEAPSSSFFEKNTDNDISASSPERESSNLNASSNPIMLFLLAKGNSQLAGYELLQTLLAAGLRFGEGHLFHRHQSANGQGPVMFSLAAATASGVFDMQNIGAFSVRGLCLFMESSENPTIDTERLNVMLETAKQLSDDLDTHLLDYSRQPLTKASIRRYYQMLRIEPAHQEVYLQEEY